jgi:hypothetical protein
MDMNFDLSNVRTVGTGAILPPGDYEIVIKNAEPKQTKDGETYINLWYSVVGPTHTGVIVFEALHLWSGNTTRTEISLQHLKSIREACGLNPNIGGTTDELINKRLRIRVGIREYNGDQYQSFKRYAPCVAAAAAAASAASVPPQGGAAPAGMPW